MAFLSEITYLHWLIFGLFMIILEVFLPSAIFLWPGFAAILIGMLAFVATTLSPLMLVVFWAVLSVAFAFGWQLYRKANPAPTPVNSMNRRGEQYVGRHFTLTKDITDGVGELNVDDTRWKIVSGQDLPLGKKVKVLSVEGTSLRVEEFTA